MKDDLLTGLRSTVNSNLARFSRMRKRYLDQPPQSVEALDQLAQLAQLPSGAADALRICLHSDCLLLHTLTDTAVYLLTMRQHRQRSFDFDRLWPG